MAYAFVVTLKNKENGTMRVVLVTSEMVGDGVENILWPLTEKEEVMSVRECTADRGDGHSISTLYNNPDEMQEDLDFWRKELEAD